MNSLWLKRITARIEAATSGYLTQIGWIETRATQLATNNNGEPIPWFTYTSIQFLEPRIDRNWRVLEFGSGMGTIWWGKRVREVIAIEHNKEWKNKIASLCNATIIATDYKSPDEYINSAINNGLFDVIIVDGIFRNECLKQAPKLLSINGIILLDDAQRVEYKPAIDYIISIGFKFLEFHGAQPISKHPGCTAILYRSNNVLGL